MTLTLAALVVVQNRGLIKPGDILLGSALGIFMLAATSLLFGLPMPFLQIKKNLEAAIAFHWWIDFMRFLFGF